MNDALAECLALAALVLSLGSAALRPRNLSEAVFAVPLAAVLVVIGVESWHDAWSSIRSLLPTVAFLALILAFGHLCAEVGVFDYLGSIAASASRGSPAKLLVIVVMIAAVVTAVLTLDATVVLLTPVVLRTVGRLEVAPRPHVYACTQLANAGSLLLPVSNLTNLLAFSASGLSFGHFAALMALPWLLASGLEWVGLRLFFRDDFGGRGAEITGPGAAPRYGLLVLAITVAGFAVLSSLHVAVAWAALGGVLLLGVPMLRRRETTPARIVREASLGFAAFVLALGVIVGAVTAHGTADALRHLIPHGTSLLALLGVTFLAAVTANLVNNLPATLVLVPLVAAQPTAVLAVLLGVNIGPNATYIGSLATLLWRRILPEEQKPRTVQFHAYGAISVPIILAATTVALWAVSTI